MSLFKKLFRRGDTTVKVVDKRKAVTPIEPINIVDEDDLAMSIMLTAAFHSENGVIGHLENGTLTIDDV
ncbi:MAG: hypothetical protein Q8L37_06175 [Candidatus Gottesmanbacteria bacterium]|nr:hypothetical protein [Candidatus Gottesmanbacteria bacterium]